MNTYTPDEMTRLELLCYENPEGIHPIEANWRNLARKLFRDMQELEQLIGARKWPAQFQQGDTTKEVSTPDTPRQASRDPYGAPEITDEFIVGAPCEEHNCNCKVMS